jgi:DNA polymerase-3 subunit alpha
LLDAISTVYGLVDEAVKNKMPALALTDHGVMYGAMEFYKYAVDRKIKPILGVEAYVAQSGSRFDRGKTGNKYDDDNEIMSDNADALSSSINYAHIVLLAKDEEGYKNLVKLTSTGHTEGFYYKPRIDLEILNKYRKGLVALSACAGGIISTYIVRRDLETARKMTGIYKDIFGEDFYLELQNHLTLDSEKEVLKHLPVFAKDFGIKTIATNDVHYIKKEHAIAHNIYLHISAKQSKNFDPSKITTDLRYGTEEIYFKTSDEMCDLFRDFPEAIKSTLEVTEKCNLVLDLEIRHMPNFPIPVSENIRTLNDYLEKIATEGMHKRFSEITPEISERLQYEIDVINKMDFAGYFLIVADFIKAAREAGILVGPGRGSAAGSLVCYCLGITNVNPLDYNLLFERFLNPARISMPDIDIDFQDDRRDEVIQYAKNKYGENSVAQIVTFNKLAPRGVLKDVGRVLNFPFNEVNELTSYIPILFGKVKPLFECLKEVPDFAKYFKTGTDEQKTKRKQLYDYSNTLENLNKNSSIHASGVVITPSDVTDYVPLSKVTGEANVFCTQYDMNQLESAGLIKIDFLGLKELKVISRTLDLINKKNKINLTVEDIPLDDSKTYELFSSGSTIGVFQFSKSKMREYLSKMKPKNINDLAAMNALYRPGPMKLIPDFIDKRFGKKPITYLHPKMANALSETYGIIVYQEQVMQIAREVAGFSMSEADFMRKAMSKKVKKKMEEIKVDFLNGALKNNVDKKTATEIWDLMFSFADYGFNKSHGVAYSILAFYTAYLKAHFPLEFFTVSMECRKDDESELQQLADECKKMNIVLSQPDVNLCDVNFTIKNSKDSPEGKILFGLSAIKNVGEKAAENIVEERNNNGEYKGFIDFLTRVDLRLVNKKALESLVFAGAFDSFENNRKKLYLNLERAVLYAQRFKETPEHKGQHGLFNPDDKPFTIIELKLEHFDEYTDNEKYSLEKSAIGFYLSGHPLGKNKKILEKFVSLNFGEDVTEIEFSKISPARVCGVISGLEIKLSKKGTKFAVFDLIDFYGTGECVAFSKIYESKTDLFQNDNPVFIVGKASENGDKVKILVEQIFPIDTFQEYVTSNFTINLFKKDITESLLEEIEKLLDRYPGNSNLFFNIIENGNNVLYRSKSKKIKANNELIINLTNLIGEDNLTLN